ncbi:hypothetical protein [Streptomyces europaeiscabiei]|uniref:hypothetical protein n=1 Tax=Streptomyces europaeiscabiei TaxID=146819 RepID=UPI0029A843B3|nr:hypothetical protein [Streptomyces europaeiscabiei]MDX3613207.1 hypothetical protein [Streptomyces europaeiscabiei]
MIDVADEMGLMVIDETAIRGTGAAASRSGVLGAFLGSRSRRVRERPPAKQGRRHADQDRGPCLSGTASGDGDGDARLCRRVRHPR